ncbi:MAG TPA: glycosyltransferase, partial [Thermoanaerobaculia bacterium]|nr:glycosyltransferase [Thermoanaerobaculia bacterium]
DDVVIPARDEESTVAGVVRAARGASGVGRVVVVDDGSSDRTAAVAMAAGATVVRGAAAGEPGSKARALSRGVEATDAGVLVFFDSDILNVEPAHFEALASPLLAGEAWLSCGIVPYGRLRDPFFLRLPPITGLRALRREVFTAIPEARRNGFQIEIMINEVIARQRLPSAIRVLSGLRHLTKVEKVGWRRGLPAHLAMSRELLACLRLVPLWTYGAYLRNLRVLPPSGDGLPPAGADPGAALIQPAPRPRR